MQFGEAAAFVRSDNLSLLGGPELDIKECNDSTSSSNSPDLEIFVTPFGFGEHGRIWFDVHTRALHVYLLRSVVQISIEAKNLLISYTDLRVGVKFV